MCGIVGYVGPRDGVPVVLEGLTRLEYRGYDSAGVGFLHSGLQVHRATGRVADLRAALPAGVTGAPAIGHTRWATHGEPTEANAHPHTDGAGRVALVHNGIIENAVELRAKLVANGVEFASDTDSETLVHLISASLSAGAADLESAVCEALRQVVGAYGIVVLDSEHPDRVVAARNGSPVLLGVGDGEMFVASDAAALVRHTRQVVYLDDGELASVRADGFRTFMADNRTTQKQPSAVDWTIGSDDIDGHQHFLHKEIVEQPAALGRTLRGRLDARFNTSHLGGLNLTPRDARAISRIKIIGCGSAAYAGQVGAHLIEELARIPADAEPASEFRYRRPVVDPATLYVAVSQSGETSDTLGAVQEIKRKGGRVLGVVNVVGSSIARECDGGIYLHAGPEVSVAATKSFTSTAAAFALLAVHLGRIRDLSPAVGRRLIDGLAALPAQIDEALTHEGHIADIAGMVAASSSVLFVGRVRGWPVAREGAQKLKEVSYVHAEAYPAAELKHGPLALVSPDVPTVVVVPDDELLEKNMSTMAEIRARRGPIIAVGHRAFPRDLADHSIVVPRGEPELDPILLSVPLQLLAYHAALALGQDVDRPRNLAKSVTVE
jgi:glutamine---fructose-6-phosphate transaminase (isomerizing)